jgi:hypothetical protein
MKQDLDRSKREASSLPPAYGSRMTELKAEIDRAAARGAFKHKPIGPIGLEVLLFCNFHILLLLSYILPFSDQTQRLLLEFGCGELPQGRNENLLL